MLNQFLWVIFPYLCLVVFVAGHIARYRYDKFSWTAKSSELIEKKKVDVGKFIISLRYYSSVFWTRSWIVNTETMDGCSGGI